MESKFNELLVSKVSSFLQVYMKQNKLQFLTADQSAELLSKNGLLTNKVGPKPGFLFRQMLRDGRDGYIKLIKGAHQVRPNTKWFIYKK